MDKKSLQKIANEVLIMYENKSYEGIEKIIKDSIYYTIKDHHSKNVVQVKISAFYEDSNTGAIRINIAVDDYGWRAFFPVVTSFVKSM